MCGCQPLLRMLEHELELRDKMFQDFREMKERELSELRKINHDLEIRLHSLVHPNESISLVDHQRGLFLSSIWSVTFEPFRIQALELDFNNHPAF